MLHLIDYQSLLIINVYRKKIYLEIDFIIFNSAISSKILSIKLDGKSLPSTNIIALYASLEYNENWNRTFLTFSFELLYRYKIRQIVVVV